MADLKEALKKVVKTFKRPVPALPETAKRVKAFAEAAKAAGKTIQNEKE